MPNSQIQFGSSCNTPYGQGCAPLVEPCDIVSDLFMGAYKDPSRIAVFENTFPTRSLYSLFAPTWMNYGVSGMFNNPNEMYYTNPSGERDLYLNIPGFGRYGSKVRMRQLAPGSGRSYTTQFEYVDNQDTGEWFIVTQEMVDASNGTEPGGSTNIGGTYTDNRLVLPPSLAHLISDNENFGCGKQCCGSGYRKWAIMKDGCLPEIVWVRAYPPNNYTGDQTFGPLFENPENPTELTGFAVFMARGMGKEPKPGSMSIEEQDFGTPNIICPGDEIRVLNLITTSKDGCLYCQPSSKTTTFKSDYVNYTERMHGTAICIDKEEFYKPMTFHGEMNALQKQFERSLKKIQHQIGWNLEFGQKTLGAGLHDLSDSLHPGTGNENQLTPTTTDGWITQILKNTKQNQYTIYIHEDECDNPCLIPQLEEMIGLRVRGANNVPFFAFGSSFLTHMETKRITNMYSSNIDNLDEAMRLNNIRRSMTGLFDDEDKYVNFFPEQMKSDLKYFPLKIAGKTVPFFKHLDLMRWDPGMLIIAPVDAFGIVTPAQNQLAMAGGFLPPTAVPGMPIPTFYDTRQYMNILNGTGQGGRFMSPNECRIDINWYLDIGADYDPNAYPNTFVIKFRGILRDGTVVNVDQLPNCSGCFRGMLNLYKQMRCDPSTQQPYHAGYFTGNPLNVN